MIKKIIFFEKILSSECSTILNKDLNIKFLNYDEISAYKHIFPKEYFDEYKIRFEKGYKCVALFIDKNIAHVDWLAFNSLRINEIGIELIMPTKEICIFDVKTLNGYQNKGQYYLMLKYITNWAILERFERIIIYSELKNIYSIKGIEKAGFHMFKRVTNIEVFGKTIISNEKNLKKNI